MSVLSISLMPSHLKDPYLALTNHTCCFHSLSAVQLQLESDSIILIQFAHLQAIDCPSFVVPSK